MSSNGLVINLLNRSFNFGVSTYGKNDLKEIILGSV